MEPVLQRAFSARVRRDVWTNFSVLRHGALDGVLVTSKNSGTHWIKYMLAVALAHDHGIAPPAYFSENGVRPYIGGPRDLPAFDSLPRLAFCHSIPHRLADWGWARRLAGLPPYVLALRHPMDALASHYAKWAYAYRVSWETYLEGDPSGRLYRCDIFWLARFWNRWGEILTRDPARVLKVTYEETSADAGEVLRRIAAHWGLGLSEAAIEVALAAGTKEAMALRIDPDGEPNVLQNRQMPLSKRYSPTALEIYRTRAAACFRHDLGYALMEFPVEECRSSAPPARSESTRAQR
jgi:hypothetical protein